MRILLDILREELFNKCFFRSVILASKNIFQIWRFFMMKDRASLHPYYWAPRVIFSYISRRPCKLNPTLPHPLKISGMIPAIHRGISRACVTNVLSARFRHLTGSKNVWVLTSERRLVVDDFLLPNLRNPKTTIKISRTRKVGESPIDQMRLIIRLLLTACEKSVQQLLNK